MKVKILHSFGAGIVCLLMLGCAHKSATYDAAVVPSKGVVYGEAVNPTEKLEIIESPVLDVCAKKGCWLKLEPPEGLKHTGYLLARFKNESFVVPSELKGKRVKLLGKYIRRRYSPASQRDLLTEVGLVDGGAPASNQPVERMEFEISTLEVL